MELPTTSPRWTTRARAEAEPVQQGQNRYSRRRSRKGKLWNPSPRRRGGQPERYEAEPVRQGQNRYSRRRSRKGKFPPSARGRSDIRAELAGAEVGGAWNFPPRRRGGQPEHGPKQNRYSRGRTGTADAAPARRSSGTFHHVAEVDNQSATKQNRYGKGRTGTADGAPASGSSPQHQGEEATSAPIRRAWKSGGRGTSHQVASYDGY